MQEYMPKIKRINFMKIHFSTLFDKKRKQMRFSFVHHVLKYLLI